jgi:glycerate-2-kinase
MGLDSAAAEVALRALAGDLYAAALAAADPDRCVRSALGSDDACGSSALFARRWSLLAAGKAARAMVTGVAAVVEHPPVSGVVVEPAGATPPPLALGRWPLAWRRARHPLPDRGGLLAARALERCIAGGAGDAAEAFVVLLSGGASALLPAPAAGVSLADKVRVTELLLAAGAPIAELNAVRKHLSRLKGGGLARRLAGRPALVLVVSDVADDDLSVIASGPLYFDATTFRDAEEVLVRRGVYDRVPDSVRRRLRGGAHGELQETTKPGDPTFAAIRHSVVASNAASVAAVASAASARGFVVLVDRQPVTGEARAAAERLLAAAAPDEAGAWARVSGGETTVTVVGDGRGGRNQELALAFALAAERDPARLAGRAWCLLSAATDGVDGPTDAAGAMVDARSLARCRSAGVDPVVALARNDSAAALEASGDLLRTGPTGTNVADLQVLLVEGN